MSVKRLSFYPARKQFPAEDKSPPGASHGRRQVLTPGFAEPLGEENHHGACRDHASAARCRGPLRASDPPMESEDAAIHLRRAQRHLHHRSHPDAGLHRDGLHLCARSGGQWRTSAVRGHQEAGSRQRPELRRASGHALCERALAGWSSDQLRDHLQAHGQDEGVPADAEFRRVGRYAQKGGPSHHPGTGEAGAQSQWHPGLDPAARRGVRA